MLFWSQTVSSPSVLCVYWWLGLPRWAAALRLWSWMAMASSAGAGVGVEDAVAVEVSVMATAARARAHGVAMKKFGEGQETVVRSVEITAAVFQLARRWSVDAGILWSSCGWVNPEFHDCYRLRRMFGCCGCPGERVGAVLFPGGRGRRKVPFPCISTLAR